MIRVFLQVRTGSSRFPNKCFQKIFDRSLIDLQIERIKGSKLIDDIVILTTNDPSDSRLVEYAKENGFAYFQGSVDNVLERFYEACCAFPCQHIVRITGDCPLIDPQIIDLTIGTHLKEGNDYTSNVLNPSFPDGLDCEVLKPHVLFEAHQFAQEQEEREHVTPFIYRRPDRYQLGQFLTDNNQSQKRWTVDYPEDFEFIRSVYEALYPQNPNFGYQEILTWLKDNRDIEQINQHHQRNQVSTESLSTSSEVRNFKNSTELFKKVKNLIPLASQTFSKSHKVYPPGQSPLFLTRGRGCYVWDVDNNQYFDLVNSLAAIILGYQNPIVNQAVSQQLSKGSILSLPSPLEMEVAEQITSMVPCAEMVRFGKNGSDVTSAAVRLARHITGRDHIALCGYHGWHDWYVGVTNKNSGVPKNISDLSHNFEFNNIASLERIFESYDDQIAAVILEPCGSILPEPGFLQAVKKQAHEKGALLIFDETITGFRVAQGGAQEFFQVTPDLSTFGKAIANGFPLSVLAGSKELMKEMDKIFFSSTFGGELVSLAAAHACLGEIQKGHILPHISEMGNHLRQLTLSLFSENNLDNYIDITGLDCWSYLKFKNHEAFTGDNLRSYFLAQLYQKGVLSLGSHNLTYAFKDDHIKSLVDKYRTICNQLQTLLKKGNHEIIDQFQSQDPVFKIR